MTRKKIRKKIIIRKIYKLKNITPPMLARLLNHIDICHTEIGSLEKTMMEASLKLENLEGYLERAKNHMLKWPFKGRNNQFTGFGSVEEREYNP